MTASETKLCPSIKSKAKTSEKGNKIHFDVMLPMEGNDGEAASYAKDFINKIAESTDYIKLESCKFCHTEEAKRNVSAKV